MVMAPSALTITTEEHEIISLDRDSFINHGQIRDGMQYGKTLVHDALKGRIQDIDTDGCSPGEEDAFFVADMGEVYRQHLRWKMNLKRVKPHYGQLRLYSLPHQEVVTLMSCSRQMQPRH